MKKRTAVALVTMALVTVGGQGVANAGPSPHMLTANVSIDDPNSLLGVDDPNILVAVDDPNILVGVDDPNIRVGLTLSSLLGGTRSAR